MKKQFSAKKSEPVIKVINVKHVGGYKLSLEFSNGKPQVVDFEPFLSASLHLEIQKYLKLSNFKKFKLEDGELMRGDYDLIFPVMDLYDNNLDRNQNKA